MNDFDATTSEVGVETIRDEIVNMILEDKEGAIRRNGDVYDVRIAAGPYTYTCFRCSYPEKKIKRISSLCCEYTEELRKIHENGYTKELLEYARSEDLGVESTDIRNLYAYETFSTEHLEDIFDKIVKAVGLKNKQDILIEKLRFIQGVFVVFNYLMEDFEDQYKYFSALEMLIFLAMRMNSEDTSESDEMRKIAGLL